VRFPSWTFVCFVVMVVRHVPGHSGRFGKMLQSTFMLHVCP
jgi:hypothetical protein